MLRSRREAWLRRHAGTACWLEPATTRAIAVIVGHHALKLNPKIPAALRSP